MLSEFALLIPGGDKLSPITNLHSFCVHLWLFTTRCLFLWDHTYPNGTGNINFFFQLKLNRTMPWKTRRLNVTRTLVYFNTPSGIVRVKVRAEINSKRSRAVKITINLGEATSKTQTG